LASHSLEDIDVTRCKTITGNGFINTDLLKESKTKGLFKYYTGFPYERFMEIFDFLVPASEKCPIEYTTKRPIIYTMKLKDQFLLTIVKLRQAFDFLHIAHVFGISHQESSDIFNDWINFMYHTFGAVPIWPGRETLYKRMPPKFKTDFPDVFVILDGTEMKVQSPSSLAAQSQMYSDYKSATTLKGLVGIDPRGSVIFISMLFTGACSDKKITNDSGLLSVLK
jgi:hypothetical protein